MTEAGNRLKLVDIGDSNLASFLQIYELLAFQQDKKRLLKRIGQFVYSKIAFVKDKPAGIIYVDDVQEKHGNLPENSVYLEFVGVKVMNRSEGIATSMMKDCLEYLESLKKYDYIVLHVQKNNEDAINLYKKFNFEVLDTIPRYYPRFACEDAYLMTRKLQ
ncbi:unnamed protein product [Bursaphelenchus okinawaensis]|uniref:N-terminal methionine N(alpha)-acetyltransferase NatE n=1 Tax=Bursaphelenchus okinawaensis TaxID=465554 RepID=A0A811KBH4_9BILA|nr:unnamed protein product [Bursaphelenchus okinawaensis]CAG9096722.1 unnamed protein product [Bursaphelenchus okinawaensis]